MLFLSLQPSQFFKFFKQVQDQGAPGEVDPQVILQSDRGLHPSDFYGGELPFHGIGALWRDKSFFNHVMNMLRIHSAEPAEIRQATTYFLVKNDSLDVGDSVAHFQTPSLARGLVGIRAAIFLYNCCCSTVFASGTTIRRVTY